jgi:hypothetical protein
MSLTARVDILERKLGELIATMGKKNVENKLSDAKSATSSESKSFANEQMLKLINTRLKYIETSVTPASAEKEKLNKSTVEELENRFESNIAKLQVMMSNSQKSDFAKLDKQLLVQYKKLDEKVNSLAKNSVTLEKHEELQTFVDYLANSSISPNDYASLKTVVDELVANSVPKEKRNDLNELIKLLAENNISPERCNRLEALIDSLFTACSPSEQITLLINNTIKSKTKELQKLFDKKKVNKRQSC